MFTPSSNDVRRFFCEAWRKRRAGEILTPMDAIAADWIDQHPEYHDALMDADAYAKSVVAADFEEPGEEDVFRKVRGDLDKAKFSDHAIRVRMADLLETAAEQIQSETKK